MIKQDKLDQPTRLLQVTRRFVITSRWLRVPRWMIVDQHHGCSREMERLLQNAAYVDGGLSWRAFRDTPFGESLVLTVQEYSDDSFLSLAGEAWAEVIGYGPRGSKRGRSESAGTDLLSELESGFDLRDFRRSQSRHFQQVLNMGAIEATKAMEVLQKRPGEVGRVLPWDSFLERALADPEDDREQFCFCELVGPHCEKALPRAFLFGPVPDTAGFHACITVLPIDFRVLLR